VDALIISADDFGYAAPYDRGILDAASAGAVDAVSVMVKRGPVDAEALLETGVEAGLHLELGTGAIADDAERDAAQASLREQLGAFESAFGRTPAFLDGHHHCHATPGLAGVVAALAAERGLIVRSVDAAHRRLLHSLGVATPDLLVGRLEQTEPVLPAEIEALMLGDPTSAGVVEWMVHPGHADPRSGSAYDSGREQDLRLVGDLLDSGALRGLRATHAAALGA